MSLPSDLAEAERLHADGRHAAAMPLLEAHCARHPGEPRGRYLLAVVRRAGGDPEGAEQAVRPLLGVAIAPALHVAALIALDRGDDVEAERRLRRALVCGPAHPGAWQALAVVRPAGRGAVGRAAAAAIVDPGDPEGWIRLRTVIAMSGDPAGSARDRRLLRLAIDHSSAASPELGAAAQAMLPDWRCGGADEATLVEREDAIVRWLIHLTAQVGDPDAALAGLDRHLRRLALWHPGRRAPWLGLLVVHGRDAAPADRALLRAARRVVAFGGLFGDAARLDRPFRACVEAKAVQAVAGGLSAGIVGHAAGLQAISDTLGAPVSLRWENGHRLVRIGGREIRYAPSSPSVVGFVARLFLFEPGLWRWMAGFGPNDVLLDIGANIGVYSIAAAGLFGVPVAALEPYEPNLRALRRNIVLNRLDDRILVLPVAATDTARIDRLYHQGGSAGAAAQHFGGGAVAEAADQPFDEVEGVPVDALIESGRIPFPTRIKIDVDGNERAVIEGMTRTLADPRLHSVRLEVRWRVPEGRAVVERVRSFGFEAKVDDDDKNLLFARPIS